MTSAEPESLRVLLWQRAASLESAENRAALGRLPGLVAEHGGADLVVLPEASARDFGTPGSDLAPYAEPLDGPFTTTLRALAEEQGWSVVGGMFETAEDPARPYNTLVLAEPGRSTTYRKVHLYDSFGYRESDRVSPGEPAGTTADLGGLRLGLMTCYDLRFPELARLLSAAGADVLVVPAAWVAGPRKVEHWRTLLRARAIENLCWVVGCGQPGPRYSGHSMVVAPTGDVVAEAGEDEAVLTATLDLSAVRDARAENPSLGNRRL